MTADTATLGDVLRGHPGHGVYVFAAPGDGTDPAWVAAAWPLYADDPEGDSVRVHGATPEEAIRALGRELEAR